MIEQNESELKKKGLNLTVCFIFSAETPIKIKVNVPEMLPFSTAQNNNIQRKCNTLIWLFLKINAC